MVTGIYLMIIRIALYSIFWDLNISLNRAWSPESQETTIHNHVINVFSSTTVIYNTKQTSGHGFKIFCFKSANYSDIHKYMYMPFLSYDFHRWPKKPLFTDII